MNRFFGLIGLLSLLFVIESHAGNDDFLKSDTEYSKLIASYQAKFAKEIENVDVLFVDKDQVELNVAKLAASLTDKTPLKQVYQIVVGDYVEKHTAYSVSEAAQVMVADFLFTKQSHAVRVSHADLLKKGSSEPHGGETTLCIVLGRKPDQDEKFQKRYMSGISKTVAGELSDKKMSQKMHLSLETMNQYADFHEMGHCLDTEFLPKALEPKHANDTVIRHQSETFAEIFATLYMAKIGKKNVARPRALHRVLGISTISTGAAIHAKLMSAEDVSGYSGFVYALHRALLATQAEVDKKDFSNMSLKGLAEFSSQLTKKVALNNQHSDAFWFFLANRFQTPGWGNKENWERWPHMKLAFDYAQELKTEMLKALQDAFSMSKEESVVALDKLSRHIPSTLGEMVSGFDEEYAEEDRLRNLYQEKLITELSKEIKNTQVSVEKLLCEKKDELRKVLKSENSEKAMHARLALSSLVNVGVELFKLKK